MAQIINDTFTGTNGDAPGASWVFLEPTGSCTIQNNRLRMRVDVGVDNFSRIYGHLTDTAIIDSLLTFDFVVDASVLFNDIYLRIEGIREFDGDGGYGWQWQTNTNSFILSRGGIGTVATLAVPDKIAGDVIHFKFRIEGADWKARAWKNADSEPGTWGAEWTDPSPDNDLRQFSLHARNFTASDSDMLIDNLILDDDPDAGAPPPVDYRFFRGMR